MTYRVQFIRNKPSLHPTCLVFVHLTGNFIEVQCKDIQGAPCPSVGMCDFHLFRNLLPSAPSPFPTKNRKD